MVAITDKNAGLDPRCGKRSRPGTPRPTDVSCTGSVPPVSIAGPAGGPPRRLLRPGKAEAAGFRACKRCLPGQETPSTGLVRRVCKYIQERSDESRSVPTLAELG